MKLGFTSSISSSPGRAESTAAETSTDQYRLVQHKSGEVELYDHNTPEGEVLNIAEDHPETVRRLKKLITAKMGIKAFVFAD